MHIGLLTPSLAGLTPAGSGIGVHFRHLAEGLVAAGHAVTCVLPLESGLPGSPSDLPFRVVPALGRAPRLLPLAGRLSWQLHQWLMLRACHRAAATVAGTCADIHVWETTSTGSPALGFLDRHPRAPIVTRISTTATQLRTNNAGPATWIARRIEAWERRVIQASDALVTHTVGHREALAREFGLATSDVLMVPHGIPLVPAPAERQACDQPRILFVGRLEHRKGIDLLLSALPTALAAHPGAHADIVGHDPGGAHEQRWRTTAPAELLSRVHFHRILSDADLARAYSQADVFVAPSRYESFGLIFIEAMAHALPVVALATPGALDLIEPEVNGLLVPPDDAAALARAITRLLHAPGLRNRLGRAGRRLAETRYSRDTLIQASLGAYTAALGKARA